MDNITSILNEELLCNVPVQLFYGLFIQRLEGLQAEDQLVLELDLRGDGVPIDGQVRQARQLLEHLVALLVIHDLVVKEAQSAICDNLTGEQALTLAS